jgi:hypothetical protein
MLPEGRLHLQLLLNGSVSQLVPVPLHLSGGPAAAAGAQAASSARLAPGHLRASCAARPNDALRAGAWGRAQPPAAFQPQKTSVIRPQSPPAGFQNAAACNASPIPPDTQTPAHTGRCPQGRVARA